MVIADPNTKKLLLRDVNRWRAASVDLRVFCFCFFVVFFMRDYDLKDFHHTVLVGWVDTVMSKTLEPSLISPKLLEKCEMGAVIY